MAKSSSRKEQKRPYNSVDNTAIWSFLHITIYHKIAAVLTAALFLFNILGADIGWALQADIAGSNIRLSSGEGQRELKIDSFQIPEALGSVKNRHKGNRGTIIYIQDAHCNYAAQKAISNIINHLNQIYAVDLINLEGGEGDYDLSLFTDIKDKDVRKRVSDYFAKEGRVTGAEFFAINNPQKVTLFGIEEAELYIKNLNVYRESLKYITNVNNTLDYITSRINELKKHIYTDKLIRLDSEYISFKDEAVDLKEFIQYLFNLSIERNINLKKFPNIRSLYKAISKEKDINFKKANSERNELIEKLKEKLSDNAMDELTLKTFLFKAGQLSQSTYYNYLKKLADKYRIDLNEKNNLLNYIIYINLYEEADKEEVFNEIEELFELIAKKEFKNNAQKTLFRISKNTQILKNIFNIKATKREINYFNKHKREFDISAILDFIEEESLKYGQSTHFDNSARLIDIKRDKILKFYKYALARDGAFLKNIKKSHKRFNKDTSIIVAGGFHTENLTALFKKNGFSYLVIRPTFKNGNNYKSPYYKLLSGGLTTFEAKIVEAISAIAIASPFTDLGKHFYSTEDYTLSYIKEELLANGEVPLKTEIKGPIKLLLKNGDVVVVEDKEDKKVIAELKIGKEVIERLRKRAKTTQDRKIVTAEVEKRGGIRTGLKEWIGEILYRLRLALVIRRAALGRRWYDKTPIFRDEKDILGRLDGKQLVELVDPEEEKRERVHLYKEDIQYSVVTPETQKLFIKILDRFEKELEIRGQKRKHKIAIGSITRDLGKQLELNEKAGKESGIFPAPVVANQEFITKDLGSIHLTGNAFDIRLGWFQDNIARLKAQLKAKDATGYVSIEEAQREYEVLVAHYEALMNVLTGLQKEGRINLVFENTKRVAHVERNPHPSGESSAAEWRDDTPMPADLSGGAEALLRWLSRLAVSLFKARRVAVLPAVEEEELAAMLPAAETPVLTLKDFSEESMAYGMLKKCEELLEEEVLKGRKNVDEPITLERLHQAAEEGYIEIDIERETNKVRIKLLPIPAESFQNILELEHCGIIHDTDILGYRDVHTPTYLKIPGAIILIPAQEGSKTYRIDTKSLIRKRALYIDPEGCGLYGPTEYGWMFMVLGDIPQNAIIGEKRGDDPAIVFGRLLHKAESLEAAKRVLKVVEEDDDERMIEGLKKRIKQIEKDLKKLQVKHNKNRASIPAVSPIIPPSYIMKEGEVEPPAAKAEKAGFFIRILDGTKGLLSQKTLTSLLLTLTPFLMGANGGSMLLAITTTVVIGAAVIIVTYLSFSKPSTPEPAEHAEAKEVVLAAVIKTARTTGLDPLQLHYILKHFLLKAEGRVPAFRGRASLKQLHEIWEVLVKFGIFDTPQEIERLIKGLENSPDYIRQEEANRAKVKAEIEVRERELAKARKKAIKKARSKEKPVSEVLFGQGDTELGKAFPDTFLHVQIDRKELLARVNNTLPAFIVEQRGKRYIVERTKFFEPTIREKLIEKYQEVLQHLIDNDPRLGEFFSRQANVDEYLDYFALSDFQLAMVHRIHERTKPVKGIDFIKKYIYDALDGKRVRDPSRGYRKFVLKKLRNTKPDRRQVIITDSIPERIILGTDATEKDWANSNVMIVDERYYNFPGWREIPGRPGQTYPGEKVIIARWKNKIFMFYTSRSHTVKGLEIHQWRNCDGFVQGRFLKQRGVENLDDVKGRLSIFLDELLYSGKMTAVGEEEFYRDVRNINKALWGKMERYPRLCKLSGQSKTVPSLKSIPLLKPNQPLTLPKGSRCITPLVKDGFVIWLKLGPYYTFKLWAEKGKISFQPKDEEKSVSKSVDIGKEFSIGRSPNNDYPVKRGTISRRHASIQVIAVGSGQYRVIVKDLNSSNGTRVELEVPQLPAAGISKDDLGAQFGGDLAFMDELLKQAKAFYRLKNGRDAAESARPREMVEFFLRHIYSPPEGIDLKGANIEELDQTELQKALEQLPSSQRPQGKIKLLLLDLPQDKHAKKFQREVISQEGGIRAINYRNTDNVWTVIVLKEDYKRYKDSPAIPTLKHEFREIALRQKGLHWIDAHNKAVEEEEHRLLQEVEGDFSYEYKPEQIMPPNLKQTYNFLINRNGILEILKRQNWYYQSYSDNQKKIFERRIFNGLAETIIEEIKELVVIEAKKEGYQIEKDDILAVMVYGSWCYALEDSYKPSDLDLAVIIRGDMPNTFITDCAIQHPERWFKTKERSVEACDIRMIGADQLLADPLDKDIGAVDFETSMWGHGLLLEGINFLRSPPTARNLIVKNKALITLAMLYATGKFTSMEPDRLLIKIRRRVDEAERIFKVIFSNEYLGKGDKEVGIGQVTDILKQIKQLISGLRKDTGSLSDVALLLSALYDQTEGSFIKDRLIALEGEKRKLELAKVGLGIGEKIGKEIARQYKAGGEDEIGAALGEAEKPIESAEPTEIYAEEITLMEKLAIIVNRTMYACYSGSLVLHKILKETGLDAKVMVVKSKLGDIHYWVEIDKLIIDVYPVANFNMPMKEKKKLGIEGVIVIRKDKGEPIYSKYYENKGEELTKEEWENYAEGNQRLFFEEFEKKAYKIFKEAAKEYAEKLKELTQKEPVVDRLPLGDAKRYTQAVIETIIRPGIVDLENGVVQQDRGLIYGINNGWKTKRKNIVIFGSKKIIPSKLTEEGTILEGVDKSITGYIEEVIELFRSEGCRNLHIYIAANLNELKEKYPGILSKLNKKDTFIYFDGRAEGVTAEDIKETFPNYMSTRLKEKIPGEGGFISIEGLAGLAIAAIDLRERVNRKEAPDLRHIYEVIAALSRKNVNEVKAEWEKRDWNKEPINAFILSDLNKEILEIPVMPININVDIRQYYKTATTILGAV